MSATAQTLRPPSRTLMFLEGRAIHELGAFIGALPLLSLAPRGDGHPVLVLPGLVASDTSTRPLRSFLNNRGYAVSGWRQGRNLGLRDGVQRAMVDLVRELSDAEGRKISLVGWSLGGVYARQLAKMMPDRVRSVITLGSPFAGHPKATNAWRVYEMASGRRADEEDTRFGGSLSTTPPVPTTAIFSRTDGICAWQGCMETPSARSENIEVESSHCGMGHHPAVVYAVAARHLIDSPGIGRLGIAGKRTAERDHRAHAIRHHLRQLARIETAEAPAYETDLAPVIVAQLMHEIDHGVLHAVAQTEIAALTPAADGVATTLQKTPQRPRRSV